MVRRGLPLGRRRQKMNPFRLKFCGFNVFPHSGHERALEGGDGRGTIFKKNGLINCVTLGYSLSLNKAQYLHLYHGNNTIFALWL